MIFILIAAGFGITRYRFWDYWRWVVYAIAWSVVSGILLPGGGTLEDPRGDGLLTRAIRQATDDGPLMGLYAIGILALIYGGMIYFLSRAYKVVQAHQEAGRIDEIDSPLVPTARKFLEGVGVFVIATFWWFLSAVILSAGGPRETLLSSSDGTPAAVQPDQVALDLRALAAQINARPMQRLDDVTVQTGATAEGRTLTYHFKADGPLESEEAFQARAEAITIPKVCADPGMRKDMDDLGVTYRYAYKFPNRDREVAMEVNSAACRS